MEQKPAHELLNQESIFAKYGYQIFRGDVDKFNVLKGKFRDYLAYELNRYGLGVDNNFELKDYHNCFVNNSIEHYKFIDKIKRIIPPDIISTSEPMILLILENASNLFGKKASIYNERIEFRVVRPNCDDNNSLHRDHWFPYFKPLINIYLPLESSYSDSAMKVVPGSHLWSDEDVIPEFPYEGGKKINSAGIAFSVPGIKYTNKKIIEHRPDILPGDYMLFSPMAIHGGGDNLSIGTRFSFEIRIQFKN